MIKGKYYYEVDTNIIPKNLIYNHEVYSIIKIHSSYHIKKYYVIVNNFYENIVVDVILSNCYHPNAYGGEKEGFVFIDKPNKYSKFCLPDTILNNWKFSIDPDYIKQPNDNILSEKDFESSFLKTWAMDNPHHYPYKNNVVAEKQIFNQDGTITKELFKYFL